MPDATPTVADLVARATERLVASGSASPRLDAELLMGAALGVDRTGVIAYGGTPAGTGSAATFEDFVARRERGEPVAYIRGFREFHGLAIATDRRALIPRPETELLVDEAITFVVARLTAEPRPPGAPRLRIADVGTGTGAIAVALLAALRKRHMDTHVTLVAVELWPDALDLARENAVGHGVADRMLFREADLLPRGRRPVCPDLRQPALRRDRRPPDAGAGPRLRAGGGARRRPRRAGHHPPPRGAAARRCWNRAGWRCWRSARTRGT